MRWFMLCLFAALLLTVSVSQAQVTDGAPKYEIVRQGDTEASFAARYNLSVDQLRRLNRSLAERRDHAEPAQL